jgi:hypothetical protein
MGHPLPPEPPWTPRFAEGALFWPVAGAAARLAAFEAWPTVEAMDAALAGLSPVRFEAQAPKPRRRRGPVDARALYDGRIVGGVVPTRRDNWHDLLNALCWCAFPRAKRAVHARQHAAIAARVEPGARTLPGARTRELDGLALLDEGGIVLLVEGRVAGGALAALEARDAGPVVEAVDAGHAAVAVFGHAVYEHLVRGAPDVRAMTHPVIVDGPLPASAPTLADLVDERLAAALEEPASFADPSRFASLPVEPLCAARAPAT